MKTKPNPVAFNLKDAARYIGICEPTMLALIRNEMIPARKVGRRWIISKVSLDKWLEEIEVIKDEQ